MFLFLLHENDAHTNCWYISSHAHQYGTRLVFIWSADKLHFYLNHREKEKYLLILFGLILWLQIIHKVSQVYFKIGSRENKSIKLEASGKLLLSPSQGLVSKEVLLFLFIWLVYFVQFSFSQQFFSNMAIEFISVQKLSALSIAIDLHNEQRLICSFFLFYWLAFYMTSRENMSVSIELNWIQLLIQFNSSFLKVSFAEAKLNNFYSFR